MMTIGRKWLLASATFALAALPALASAQYGMPTPAPPQSMPGRGQPAAAAAAPAPATAPELIAAAACLIGRNPAAADPLFATAPFSPAERQLAVRLLADMQRCAHRPPMNSSAALIRGALAEAAVEARFPAQPPARSPALGAAPLLRIDQATTLPSAATFAPAYALAECTARQHPELVQALLATEPASAAAGAAFTALNPAFVACLTPGAQLNVDGRMLRGLLAENLYRGSVVQRDGPASLWAAAPAPGPTLASH
jgi:hypothetical protein